MRTTICFASILASLSLNAGVAAAPSGHTVMGRDLEPLRSDFNAADGHVRAVLLVSPT